MKALPLLLVLGGCANLMGQSAMNPDQLRAVAADKNASTVCTKVVAPGWTGTVVVSNLDKTVTKSGVVSVDDTCKTTITVGDPPK